MTAAVLLAVFLSALFLLPRTAGSHFAPCCSASQPGNGEPWRPSLHSSAPFTRLSWSALRAAGGSGGFLGARPVRAGLDLLCGRIVLDHPRPGVDLAATSPRQRGLASRSRRRGARARRRGACGSARRSSLLAARRAGHGLDLRHGCVFHRPALWQTQTCPVNQSREDLGGRRRSAGGSQPLRVGMGVPGKRARLDWPDKSGARVDLPVLLGLAVAG